MATYRVVKGSEPAGNFVGSERLLANPGTSLKDCKHIVSIWRHNNRVVRIQKLNENTAEWVDWKDPGNKSVSNRRNRSGSIGTKDADYAKDLEMWVYSGIANELKPHMGGTIADKIAAAAGKAARTKYLEIAKRNMVR